MVTEFSAGNVVAGACNWNVGGGCTVELQYSDDPARMASRSSSGRASDFSGLRKELISLCVAGRRSMRRYARPITPEKYSLLLRMAVATCAAVPPEERAAPKKASSPLLAFRLSRSLNI